MYFAAGLKSMLPDIVWPIEVALAQFQCDLERMLLMRGKVGSLPELPVYIQTLKAFGESLETLKARFFEQSDKDTDQTISSAETSVQHKVITREFADEAIKETGEVETVVVSEVKKAFDHKIKRAKTMLEAANALQRSFAPK